MNEKTFKNAAGFESKVSVTYVRLKELNDKFTGAPLIALEGFYDGSVPNTYNEEKDDYRFRDEGGNITVINGCGSLKFYMSKVKVGEYCQVLFKGTKVLEKYKDKKGSKPAYQFEVLVADSE